MNTIYQKYCEEAFDNNGVLKEFHINCPDTFNFAYDVVDVIAQTQPDRRAMMWCNAAGDERMFTFGEMSAYSNKVANYLFSQGIKKGDRVMLILKRHYEYWPVLLALHKIGAVAIPATHLLTRKDIIYRVQLAEVKAIVCTNEGVVSDSILEASADCPTLDKLFIVRQDKPGFINISKETEAFPEDFNRVSNESNDPMLLYFTSGTTGYPKMVIQDYSYPLAHIITAKYWHNVNPDGLHLTVAETGWAKASWGKIYGQWLVGAGIMVYDFDKFAPHDLLTVLEKYKVTTFCAPPTIFRFFIKEGIGNVDLSCLEYVTTAGEALNPEVYKKFFETTGMKIMEGFGQTETTLLLVNLVNSKNKVGSMGLPSPLYNVDIINDNQESAAPMEVGEVVVRPPIGKQYGLFNTYYKAPELNKFVWRNGVYHTGDTAYRDEDGYYWYVGRTDDLIKASGYRIGPFEVESVLMEHPAVLECGVTGVPDEIRGQIIKATIVLTRDYQPSDELANEIQNYVKENTAPYKYPRIVEFVEQLPKTISGKIRRVVLRGEAG